MPRLDAERLGLWRDWQRAATLAERTIDDALLESDEMPLAWFDVLATLQRAGGTMRVGELCAEVGAVPSSLSRRLDRLEQVSWVQRRPAPNSTDGRAVDVILTKEGREMWRDANVTYRRLVQQVFASKLTDTDIAAITRVLGKLSAE
jgi:DNA-binding MarR family transcriptional regulator